jgi:hypothetical protein
MQAKRLWSAIPLLAILPTLAGCGTPHWSKAGASKDTVAADLADCNAQADALIKREANIESDIMATRAPDWQRTGTIGINQAGMSATDKKRTNNYVEDCMRAKGYGPAS